MKKLRTRKDIVIVRPDKGSRIVILGKDRYYRKNFEIIDDTVKLKKLKDNLTLSRKGQSQWKIKGKDLFDDQKIYPCVPKPSTFYGLPKTYKTLFNSDDFCLRPIILTEIVKKFLSEFLNPVVSKEHCAENLFRFCEEIQLVNSKDNLLVLYDVCSLFTSKPLQKQLK